MKNFLLLFSALFLAVLPSCNDEKDPIDPPPGGGGEENEEYLELSSTDSGVRIADNKRDAAITATENGGTFTFTIDTNLEKIAVSVDEQSWASGVLSGNTLTVTIDENESVGSRTNRITLSVGTTLWSTISIGQAGQEDAELTVDAEEFYLLMTGDSHRFNVISNKPWLAYSEEDWLKVETEGDVVIISAPANETGSRQYATVIVEAGTEDNGKSAEISVIQSGGEMILIYEVPENNTEIALPMDIARGSTGYRIDVTVDWGDGNVPMNFVDFTPVYTYAQAGIYEVMISGTVEYLSCNHTVFTTDLAKRDYLIEVKEWGYVGIKNMSYAFYNNAKLTSIPDDIYGCFTECTEFYSTFYGTGITELPAGLLTYASQVTRFYAAFSGMQITSVPADFFAGCTSAYDFGQVFRNCAELVTVGDRVFKNCAAATTFLQAFYGCPKLQTLPVNIFDDCRQAANFSNAFSLGATVDGSPLKGESPYTVINGTKVHLYERNNYPGEFSPVTTITSAFNRRNGLDDWDEIVAAGWAAAI